VSPTDNVRALLSINLPDKAKLLPFCRAHALLIRHNHFQRVAIDHTPHYLDMIEGQAQIGEAFSAIENGRVVACFGITPICPGVAEAWMIVDRTIAVHTMPLARMSRCLFDGLGTAAGLHRCQITVNSQDTGAVRFAQWCKFETEGLLRKAGPDESDHYIMARLY
jgi:hypothetical protein